MTAVEVDHVVEGRADGPPLVFSNSLGALRSMWDPQVAALGDRFRIVRYDLRGHGASPLAPGPYTIDDLGADLLALLDRLEIARAHLCGLSLGGMVSLWAAIHAPGRVDRLVLCCTSARLGPPEMWVERAETVRAEGTGALADGVLERWLSPAFRRLRPRFADELRAQIAATPAEAYAGCCAAIQHMDLVPQLGEVRAPTLVIAGSDDPSTPPDEHGARIAAGVPGARMEVLDGARHLANVERADAVNQLLLDHLTR